MADEDTAPVVVIDNGSATCKAGFAGDGQPKIVVPTVIGRPKDIMLGAGMLNTYIGDAARTKRAFLTLKYPIEHGHVTSWDDMEAIWHHIFQRPRMASEECTFLMSEPPHNSKDKREVLTQIMFETFNVPALYVANQPMLALYATGLTTGTVLDCGHGQTHAVPVYEGHALQHAISDGDISGHDLTEYLADQYNRDGHKFSSSAERESVSNSQKMLAHVALDYERELTEAASQVSHRIINMAEERLRCTEALFQPSLNNRDSVGIHELIYNSINKCDEELHDILYQNIILSGGSTLFPGLADRLRKELGALTSDEVKVEVIAPEERGNLTWVGGSVLGSHSTFKQMCISKQEYEEHGRAIVHLRCF